MKKAFALVCAIPFVVVFACGGGEKPPESPTTTPSATPSDTTAPSASASTAASTTPSASASAAAPGWKDMTHEQKMAVMKSKVLPKMSDDFQGVDKKKYAEFGCKTCHGEGAKDGGFKMPNPKLPKLPTDPAGFKALAAKKPDIMKFMGEKVKPDMANLLGVEQFEPGKNESGFGCYNCHEKATK
jgi:hypothetical protein